MQDLIRYQLHIGKIYLCGKYPMVDLNHCDGPKTFIEYSKDLDNIYGNIDKYNLDKIH